MFGLITTFLGGLTQPQKYIGIGVGIFIFIVGAFSYIKIKEHNAYERGYQEATNKINATYVELIDKKVAENNKKVAEQTNLYVNAIKENNDMKIKMSLQALEVKKWKSKAFTNKDCVLEKYDVDKFNSMIKELSK
jgi:hypothetical protein